MAKKIDNEETMVDSTKETKKKRTKKAESEVEAVETTAFEAEEEADEMDGISPSRKEEILNNEQFKEKIEKLLQIAKQKKNVIEDSEIVAVFADKKELLTDEGQEVILEYFEKKGIDVLTITKDEDDVPPMVDDDDFETDEAEDIDLDSLDLSVPDGISMEDPVRMYLKEIGKVPLLSADEEIRLATIMENGQLAERLETEYFIGENEDAVISAEVIEEFWRLTQRATEDEKDAYQKELASKISAFEGKTKKDMKRFKDAGDTAKKKLAEANLRLVVSIAKRYVGRGMLFLDLIQEGNLGLIKAVEKFDYRKGYKFSTYATWWIRQAITRAIADQARTIRIPVHMVETINKLIRVSRQLLQSLGREATPEEIAKEMEIPVERVREIIKISQEPVSLETPIGEEEDSHLGDFIQDDNVPVPADAAAFTLLKEQLGEVLGMLSDREQKVLRLRFGLDDGRARTLEEVGKEFNVTRERIRQIEAKALRKLRHPNRSRKLKEFLE